MNRARDAALRARTRARDATLRTAALAWSLHDIQRAMPPATIRRMAWLVTRYRFATARAALDALRVVREEAA